MRAEECSACDQQHVRVRPTSTGDHVALPSTTRGRPVSLLKGHRERSVNYVYQLHLEVPLPAEERWFTGVPRIALRVCMPEGYPQVPPKVVADPVPFHPNVDQADGTVALGETISMRGLPDAYYALLSSPQLSSPRAVLNTDAAALYASEPDLYRILAAHSIGQTFPSWSPRTHAALPRGMRDVIRTMLIAVRVREWRAAAAAASGTRQQLDDAAPSVPMLWPWRVTMPDEVLARIFALYVHGELRTLCRRHAPVAAGGWSGHECRC